MQQRNIGKQCPLLGGNAVFCARSMLALIDLDEEYDDVYLCLQGGVILREKKDREPLATLYPNPARNTITLGYEIAEETTAQFYVYNVMGQQQLNLSLTGGKSVKRFDVSSFTPGLYSYSIVTSDSKTITGKFVVNR